MSILLHLLLASFDIFLSSGMIIQLPIPQINLEELHDFAPRENDEESSRFILGKEINKRSLISCSRNLKSYMEN